MIFNVGKWWVHIKSFKLNLNSVLIKSFLLWLCHYDSGHSWKFKQPWTQTFVEPCIHFTSQPRPKPPSLLSSTKFHRPTDQTYFRWAWIPNQSINRDSVPLINNLGVNTQAFTLETVHIRCTQSFFWILDFPPCLHLALIYNKSSHNLPNYICFLANPPSSSMWTSYMCVVLYIKCHQGYRDERQFRDGRRREKGEWMKWQRGEGSFSPISSRKKQVAVAWLGHILPECIAIRHKSLLSGEILIFGSLSTKKPSCMQFQRSLCYVVNACTI